MIRTFGAVTLNGNAQPLFGDKITAAFNGKVNNGGVFQLVVANSSIYQVGDRWILGWNSGSATNCIMVNRIVDATHVEFRSEGDAPISAWVINTQLALDIACYGLSVQSVDGNTAVIYLGADGTVTNAGNGSAFREIQKVTAGSIPDHFELFKYDGQDPLRTTEFCMAGAANDKALVAAHIN